MDQELSETPCELCGWVLTADGSCTNPTCDRHVAPEEDTPG